MRRLHGPIPLLLAGLLLLLGGCASTAHFPDNPPLESTSQLKLPVIPSDGQSEILLVMTFSGGGSRAAALSYGVLEELAATPLSATAEGRLLDELDLISSVSGGSITAAYYGLYGDRLFSDFRRDFLEKDIQSELAQTTFKPSTLSSLSSRTYGTGDVLDAYLGEKLFADATLDDLFDGDGPQIQINATDLFKGGRFGFTPGQFALICSDTTRFPVSRAVAASCAVPIIFSPITLTNRAGDCDFVPPTWFYQALQQEESDARRYQRALFLDRYLDRETHPYLHLLDGGLSDNLGLRAITDRLIEVGGAWEALKRFKHAHAKQVVIIVVNASAITSSKWEQFETHPPDSAILDAATNVPLVNYNFETIHYFQTHIERWQSQISEGQCRELDDCTPGKITLIEINLNDIRDRQRRQRMTQVPTGFTLPEGSVEELIMSGRELLRRHPRFKQLVRSLE